LNSIIKISIVLDEWKSTNNLLFQDVIRSYITRDWVQKKVLLDFESLMSTHDDAYLADMMHKILIDFEIEWQLFAIIINNADNNRTLTDFLTDSLQDRLNISWLQDQNKLSCLAHVIQLVVTAIIEALDIESFNETVATSFSDDDIAKLLSEQRISFKKTLQKICIREWRSLITKLSNKINYQFWF
jgi:hypothetical protein